MENAEFVQADFSHAILSVANFSYAYVFNAKFTSANITSVDFRTTQGLNQDQIDSACYIKRHGKTLLSAGLKLPPECPSVVRNLTHSLSILIA